jgi:hypothetical protein
MMFRAAGAAIEAAMAAQPNAIDEGYDAVRLCHGDLVGDGVMRVYVPSTEEAWYQRIPARPAVGAPSLDSAPPTTEVDGVAYAGVALGDMSITLRTMGDWFSTHLVRRSRGEWSEAVVAGEAAFERMLWHTLTLVLLDHGWTSSHFERLEAERPSVFSVLKCLRSHLGGAGEDWVAAHEHLRRVWEARNDVVHRGLEATEAVARDAQEGPGQVVGMIERRFDTTSVAKRHPLAASMILGSERADAFLGAGVSARLLDRLDVGRINDLRTLLSLPEWGSHVVAASDARASLCWPTGITPAAADVLPDPEVVEPVLDTP